MAVVKSGILMGPEGGRREKGGKHWDGKGGLDKYKDGRFNGLQGLRYC